MRSLVGWMVRCLINRERAGEMLMNGSFKPGVGIYRLSWLDGKG